MRVSMDKNDENGKYEDKEKLYRALRSVDKKISYSAGAPDTNR